MLTESCHVNDNFLYKFNLWFRLWLIWHRKVRVRDLPQVEGVGGKPEAG